MATCGKLSQCIDRVCANDSVAGLNDTIIIYNKADVSFTFDVTDPSKITAITLAAATQGYVFEGTNKTFSFMQEASRTDFGTSQYVHTVNSRIISVDFDTTGVISELQSGLFVAVTLGNNGVIRVHGVKSGMYAETTDNSAEANGTWSVVFKSEDPNFEVLPGYTYDDGTTFDAMKTDLINAASCPPVGGGLGIG